MLNESRREGDTAPALPPSHPVACASLPSLKVSKGRLALLGRSGGEGGGEGGREGGNAAAVATTGVVVVVVDGGAGPAGRVLDESVQGEEVVEGQEEGQAG